MEAQLSLPLPLWEFEACPRESGDRCAAAGEGYLEIRSQCCSVAEKKKAEA